LLWLTNPKLTLKVVKALILEANRLTSISNGTFYFNAKKIANRIGETNAKNRISAILQALRREEAVGYNSTFNKFFVKKGHREKLLKILKHITENIHLVKYYNPLNYIEPPICISRLNRKGREEIIGLAKREGLFKPIYVVNNGEFRIIFKQFRRSGFTIYVGERKVLSVERKHFTKPLRGSFSNEDIEIRRIRGRELRLYSMKNMRNLAIMKSYGFEKAVFTFDKKLNDISIPLSAALFAIKQLDVIV